MESTQDKPVARPSLRGPLLFLALAVGFLALYWGKDRSQPVETILISGPTMGTEYNVLVVFDANAIDPPSLQTKIDVRLAEINQLMSTYVPSSELSQFNQSGSLDWFSVSHETAEVVAYALSLAEQTDGVYDPTVGPLVNLWGFGPSKKDLDVPAEESITKAKAKVGYAQVEARLDPPALKKSDSNIYLDLSSVAKGYGVDAIASLLDELGFQSYMVEIGGEVRTLGTKPNNQPWRIGLENPDSQKRSFSKVLQLSGGESVATSGDYRNFFEVDGATFSHTINPQTGRPVQHDLATVTVLSESCRNADALATAILVLGPKEGYNWAVEQQVAAYLVRRTDKGPEITTTPAWDNHFPSTSEE